jgi:hypothetical protein
MTKLPKHDDTKRRIIGISLAPQMAGEVKAEAARRGISLKSLFEEMWTQYVKKPGSPKEK